MRELEGREPHFRAIGDKGETLIVEDRHPATKTIEVTLCQTLIYTLLNTIIHHRLTWCLECYPQ